MCLQQVAWSLAVAVTVVGSPISGNGPWWHHGSPWWPHGPPASSSDLPPVSESAIEDTITTSALSKLAHELEDIAYSTPDRNRVIGSPGHRGTLDWISGYLDDLSDYYTYELQPFKALYYEGDGTLTIFGNDIGGLMEYSPSGSAEAKLVAVDNVGCEAKDFPDAVEGKIALILRGECEFGQKSALAGAAGALAAVVYNYAVGPIVSATLGPPPREQGPYVPTFSIAGDKGERILAALDDGPVTASVEVTATLRNITTYNVVAETIGGDHDNVVMLGAHTDSVADGPGINDDGSGTIALLETAMQLSAYSTINAVRFGWWAAEEQGLLGSTHYVDVLNNTASEIAKVRLFLDFDMLASPNYVYAIYDGDGDAFDLPGPRGSGNIEHFYEDWFDAHGYDYVPTAFDGRSDYQAFADNGIPCGGLFTGADESKTGKEVELFGGVQGAQLDPAYHSADDNYANLNFTAFTVMTKAVAASVAHYSTSLAGIPVRGNARRGRRDLFSSSDDNRPLRMGSRWIK